MIRKKTVIVVGAGASKEANLPTGYELKKEIAKLLDIRFEHGFNLISGDDQIYAALRAYLRNNNSRENINNYLHASRAISNAMPQAISIDNFIDAHSEDKKIELCGKLGIVRAILEAERKSLLYINEHQREPILDYERIGNTWFNGFFQLLTENCRVESLAERFSSISLIIFNYDRCIEHFIFNSIQNYYRMSADAAAEIMKDLTIFHPYGAVGDLTWQKNGKSVGFGAELGEDLLLDLASQIKTFSEGTDVDASQILLIRKNVMEAEILVFLGFAFHRLNLQLLQPTENSKSESPKFEFYATALGISGNDCELIRNDIINLKGRRPLTGFLRNDLDCSKLLREYWRSLSIT